MSEVAILLTEAVIIASGVYAGKPRHVTIPSNNPVFKKAVEAYKDGNHEEVLRLGDVSANIEAFSDGLFFVVDGLVYTQDLDDPAPKVLSDRIVKFAREDLPVEPLLNFWTKLRACPDQDVIAQLYGFLEHNNIPITADGCFVAYKSVTRGTDGDLWDTYTFGKVEEGKGTYRNNVGDTPTMDREDVVKDPGQTCSQGLHVAAHNYAQNNYGFGADKVLVHVKVDPADVVSVPTDYNGEKMRCCRYEVIAVAEDEKPIETPLYDGDIQPETQGVEDEDLTNEEDIYDATEDYDEDDDDYEDPCDSCDDTSCSQHPDYEPHAVTPSSPVDLVEAHARHNGSIELPVDAVTTMGIGVPVQTIVNETEGTVSIVACDDDEDGCRRLRKGFRISGKTLETAGIEGSGTYAVEYAENIITISIR
jgi:hypothetical protein